MHFIASAKDNTLLASAMHTEIHMQKAILLKLLLNFQRTASGDSLDCFHYSTLAGLCENFGSFVIGSLPFR